MCRWTSRPELLTDGKQSMSKLSIKRYLPSLPGLHPGSAQAPSTTRDRVVRGAQGKCHQHQGGRSASDFQVAPDLQKFPLTLS